MYVGRKGREGNIKIITVIRTRNILKNKRKKYTKVTVII